jgi:hypothetical protein
MAARLVYHTNEGDTMAASYDLWLTTGCNAEPDLRNFPEVASLLRDPEFRVRLIMRQPGQGGAFDWGGKPAEYLGLELPLPTIWRLRAHLAQYRARGEIVPMAYREPRVPIEEALRLAQAEVARLNAEERVTSDGIRVVYDAPVENHRWSPMAWGFFAGAPELIRAGCIPGGRFIHIDRLDGHLWAPAERACYHWFLRDQLRGGPRASVVLREPYDVYLSMGCHEVPCADPGSPGESLLADPVVRERLLEPCPGLLGISAPFADAANVLRRCRAVEDRSRWKIGTGLSMLVPVAYREPRVTGEEALHVLTHLARERHPDERWEGERTITERELYWSCCIIALPRAGARENERPHKLSACIDKLDGHRWEQDEEDEYCCRYHDLGYVIRAAW